MRDAPNAKPPFAWQPLTPQGVAAFASARFGRLLLAQFVFAMLAAGTVLWFLHRDWFPVIEQAIGRLPEQGEIRSARLDWRGDSPILLAEGRFLALAVDLDHEGEARSPAHVAVEFGRSDFQVLSLFGFVQGTYPRDWVVGVNRADATPWWGAWEPPILALTAGLVIAGLMLSWAVLATAYFWIAWLVGFYANRALTAGGSWRLAGAALMPGALFMTGAFILYGLGVLDPLRLLVAAGAHFVIGWVYVIVSPLRLPRHPAVPLETANPFVPPAPDQAKAAGEEPPAGVPPGPGKA
jgi:hypothetical protein